MKLLQLRKGFATNSSSTHSIIIANPLTKVVLTGKPLSRGDDYNSGEFGWDLFTLASKEAKMEYLAVLIMSNLDLPDWMKKKLAESVTGIHFEKEQETYIDHQSMLALPRDWEGHGLDLEFLDELKTFLLKEEVMILGGNDNSDEPHPLVNCGEHVLTSLKRAYGNCSDQWVCRKEGDEWTLFNRDDGEKVTFTFDNSKTERDRPSAPELIDIKVTDFCPYECPHCYQDSSRKGGHAEKSVVDSIAYRCKEHKVFEVALGGGEPTLWPHFVDTLETFRHYGVVPNFTTRNLSWLRDEKLRPQILEHCGSFAYSVIHRNEVEEFATLLRRHDIDKEVAIHYVLGSAPDYDIEGILRAAHEGHVRVVLLGWKLVGRGKQGPPFNNDKWFDIVKQLRTRNIYPEIGVDTTIANEYKKQIEESGIPDYFFYTEEGKFSMYYDAVEDRWGPSSFCEEGEYVKIAKERGKDELIEAWRLIGK